MKKITELEKRVEELEKKAAEATATIKQFEIFLSNLNQKTRR